MKLLPLILAAGVIAGAVFVYTQRCKNSMLRKYLCKDQTFEVDLPSGGTGTAINVDPKLAEIEDREANKIDPTRNTDAHFKMLEGIKAGRASAYRARVRGRHYGY